MVEIQERSKSSVYGAQPRSLFIHWLKHDVTDENVCPNTEQASKPAKLSPLRQRLQQSGQQVAEKRQLLTRKQIECRIEEARLRRDASSQEAEIRRVEPRVRRSQAQNSRHQYLSEMARKRQSSEEAILEECQQNIHRIREREASMHSCIAEADEQSEHESNDTQKGI
jgi:hypothetical protein|mmetsp:Transcript_26307/g.35118  ORF Transcript_26307/g.35118 Transcript_26307/m.35118 type:complete len:168 (+) Transcript_26307:117-620(+)|eukprot:CAMPEP_0185580168 /NCGR_PEP_ID=MMETSP0434-20130131/15646_1 /TAXON_ID=626734 ORGANISM="Favella taraikaensis, Strain Fe Narragansett Bay" /NCGR_SAMPLE_ID=MMETSP0434 /ASSEMBLY_ACC=CAM_ASM_000379 /LENGTH=167 /DNA_ID=CAMNT_0028198349 /DNA_START=49 /DNA_END=552 /DNA_ORIENTATION=-